MTPDRPCLPETSKTLKREAQKQGRVRSLDKTLWRSIKEETVEENE